MPCSTSSAAGCPSTVVTTYRRAVAARSIGSSMVAAATSTVAATLSVTPGSRAASTTPGMRCGSAPGTVLQQRVDQHRFELTADRVVESARHDVHIGDLDVGHGAVAEQVGAGQQSGGARVGVDRLDGEPIDDLHSRDHTARLADGLRGLTKSKSSARVA